MTSAEIRQSFLDFFREKQHTIVPSSSPPAGLAEPAVHQCRHEPVRARSFSARQSARCDPPRAADTQKCIRAGGKHNDLDDVGLDTYHHTFFEMLGNWCFGDYFKKEAIEWAWELVVERWKFPPQRLYATVYQPGAGRSERVRPGSARSLGATLRAGRARSRRPHRQRQQEGQLLDDGRHRPVRSVLRAARRSHARRATPGARWSTQATPRCIEIWNLVFIQFNANPDGTFSPLPARHVDTGMGFERVTAIIQGTKNFTDFTGTISNYETDIFRPIFDEIEKLSGKKYGSTLPESRQHRRHRAGKDRRRLPRHRRSHPHAQLRDRRRHPAGQHGPQLRPAPHPAPRRALRALARLSRTVLLQARRRARRRRWAMSSPKCARSRRRSRKRCKREEEAFNQTLDRGIALFDEASSIDRTRQLTMPVSHASEIRSDEVAIASSTGKPSSDRDDGLRTINFGRVRLSSSTTPTVSRSISPN